jgi:ATP-dependent helicase/nuclease subunit A
MSTSSDPFELTDALDRKRAVQTFDRNLVVTAGAGTGKTTLLVDRLVHLLLRNPDPLPITEIIALTFTNKAANEMKLRLRERLQSFLAVRLDEDSLGEAAQKSKIEVGSLIARYQLSKDDLDRRVHDALRNIERSDIGTIHSFAATLLHLYPLEAGIDPQFHEDDGKEFDRFFDEQWDLWLGEELSLESGHADEWQKILGKLGLDQIRALAKSLSSEAVELGRQRKSSQAIPERLQSWLTGLESRAGALIARHPEDRINEKLVRATLQVLQGYRQGAQALDRQDRDVKSLLLDKSISDLKGWSDDEIAEAQGLTRVARGLLKVDAERVALLWALLSPFAEKFKDFFVREGFVSFDGLLVRARNLVRDNLHVREELKRQYRAILIDEFQDTDPIQYEILLYLAEQSGHFVNDWRQVKLSPGKVFVVGDPKQSIYAFRRADIEAYLEVVEKIIKAQDGVECRLTTNFRSNAGILDVVNGIFTSLIQAQERIQPAYIAIHPAPGRCVAANSRLPKVLIRKIVADDNEANAEKARRIEGESLARWLKEEVLDKTAILNSRGEQVYVQPKDVAILLRKLTDIHDYLEPFRRHGIRYVVDGERHFYAAKEIIDAVNLFRAIESPHDRLALVGVLRSPLGGLTDREIYELHREHLLDYQKANDLGKYNFPPTLGELYQTLARLHAETRVMPVGDAIAHIFATLPIKLLAACSFHGEQAVANLEKLKEQAELLGREGLTTLKEATRQLEQRVLDVKEEGESVLAEENVDAVRIMSIHKAKGLEFPIVVLAGSQSGTDARQTTDEVLFDWSTGLAGLRVGPIADLAGLYIAERARVRAEEEQKRVFYVAMTRAREHLIVSCAPTDRRSSGSFLSMLDDSLGEDIESVESTKTVRVGNGTVEIQAISQGLAAPGRGPSKFKNGKKPSWRFFIDSWTDRRDRHEAVLNKPLFVTPTLLKRQEEWTEAIQHSPHAGLQRSLALLVGDLTHRYLQQWNFGAATESCLTQLGDFVDRSLPDELRRDRKKILHELEEIFGAFVQSKIYAELTGARILGREVPLLMLWNGQIMEGVIDLIYERDGLLYLADYKTDTIGQEEVSEGATLYQHQARIYCEAVRQSLRREVARFKLIFLRLGEVVEIIPETNKEPTLF